MLVSILYMVLRGLLRLAPAGDERDREVEILVLRHQVKSDQARGRKPARMTVTSRRTAALDGRVLAAARAYRQ
jgi:hypothetical protein